MDCVAHQASLSMEFSRQEYRNGLPFPSLGDLPDPGIEPRSPVLQAVSSPSEPPGVPVVKSRELRVSVVKNKARKYVSGAVKKKKKSAHEEEHAAGRSGGNKRVEC